MSRIGKNLSPFSFAKQPEIEGKRPFSINSSPAANRKASVSTPPEAQAINETVVVPVRAGWPLVPKRRRKEGRKPRRHRRARASSEVGASTGARV